jgi:UDP-N-acetylmuramate dehydrogenase
MNILTNEPLARHTYFKLGGPADYFVEVKSLPELVEAVRYAVKENLPYLILGGGSNVLISDQGFRGLVIKNRTTGIKLKGFAGGVAGGKLDLKEVLIEAESGVPANLFIRYTLDQGLSGLEDMLGLPGTVGGAIYNNSHHLDKFWGDHIVEVTALDRLGQEKKYHRDDLHFAYDSSIFHKTHETILSATFQLTRGDKDALWETANAAVKRRSTTQPLGVPSSGCMFKNITLADKMRLGIQTTSAGYLIDKAGLKGLRVGGASVSPVHANFIVNDGTATTQDVLDLVREIQIKIKAKFGVDLEKEVFVIS